MEGGGTLSKIKFNDSQNKNENKQFSKHFRKMAAIDYFIFKIKSKGLYQTETGGKACKVSSPIDQFSTTAVYILAEILIFLRRPTQEKYFSHRKCFHPCKNTIFYNSILKWVEKHHVQLIFAFLNEKV